MSQPGTPRSMANGDSGPERRPPPTHFPLSTLEKHFLGKESIVDVNKFPVLVSCSNEEAKAES